MTTVATAVGATTTYENLKTPRLETSKIILYEKDRSMYKLYGHFLIFNWGLLLTGGDDNGRNGGEYHTNSETRKPENLEDSTNGTVVAFARSTLEITSNATDAVARQLICTYVVVTSTDISLTPFASGHRWR